MPSQHNCLFWRLDNLSVVSPGHFIASWVNHLFNGTHNATDRRAVHDTNSIADFCTLCWTYETPRCYFSCPDSHPDSRPDTRSDIAHSYPNAIANIGTFAVSNFIAYPVAILRTYSPAQCQPQLLPIVFPFRSTNSLPDMCTHEPT